MEINLITKSEYNQLKVIQKQHPILTLQNIGYETIDKSKFLIADKDAFNKVTNILKKAIVGFIEFNNFKHNKKGELVLRFQYKWSWSFTGVGYLKLSELLNGFEEKDKEVTVSENESNKR